MPEITTTRRTLGCIHCGHISCICAVKSRHLPHCRLRISATCPVALAAERDELLCAFTEFLSFANSVWFDEGNCTEEEYDAYYKAKEKIVAARSRLSKGGDDAG